MKERASDNFEFPIGINDTLFTLTCNNSAYKDNIANIISKIIIVRELSYINLNQISEALGAMKIEKLNIFSIDYNKELDTINYTNSINNGCSIDYIEIKPEFFAKFLNWESNTFANYNKNSLYIVRGGNYIDIKSLFTNINGCDVNLGSGRSQKAHLLSPLDFRLSCYIMAMFNFNYKLISYLNTFNDLEKDRYLSWWNRYNK